MKKFVFVLMPFSEDFNDVYQLGIKTACQSEKVYCERVDEQYYEGSMLDRIYNQIQHADYIVADMSTKNPNVFYEVGFAHALQKKVILITQEENDIPFDLKHFYHIIYSKNRLSALNEKIRARIDWYLSTDDMDNNNAEFELQVFVNGTLLRKNEMTDITIYLDKELYEYRNQTKYTGKISVVLKNPMSKIFSAKNNEVSVILSNNVPIDTKYNVKILPDNKILVVTNFSGEVLFPQSYWGKNIGLECWSHKKLNDDYSGEIVISTPFSQESYPFVFVFDVTS
jgi:hypothetical protein